MAAIVKEEIRRLLEKNKGEYISGEAVSQKLSVSRSAVCKAVKALQNEGYQISSATNRGYCMAKETDILSKTAVYEYLKETAGYLNIEVYKTLPSTNTFLKELAEKGAADGSAVLCEQQSAGRGRMGRTFFSPDGTGLYMSVLLRPKVTIQNAVFLTTLTGVAVCEAIEKVCQKQAKIKWVNDIYLDGKKVCGILTEGSFHAENNSLDYVVIGIGVNVFPPDGGFPEELGKIAGSVLAGQKCDIRNRLSAEILNRIFYYYHHFDAREFVGKYRELSCVIGKAVEVIAPNKRYDAVVLDIDDDCRLVVQTPDHNCEVLSSGEISIRTAAGK